MEAKLDFNQYFWSFIYLIITQPDTYLNKKGRIICRVVLEGGKCRSIVDMAKFLNVHYSTVSGLCKHINHINLVREGNRKAIEIDKSIMEEGLKIVVGTVVK